MPKRTWEIVQEIAQLHGMDGGRASELSRHRGTYEIRHGDACIRFDRRGYGHTHLTLKGFDVPHSKPFGVLATLEETAERVCDLIEDRCFHRGRRNRIDVDTVRCEFLAE